ncbi:hypothetical protein [Chitinophaga defluvii]|uniref:Uncharacterized protein n=1 Tax=Chitinophaga defluvii TaxID=3163343 RepID=A0ABV2TEL8_9BACT|nr:hypothetical protein [Bacteroidota bacterium]MBS1771266.1 hypothetical protein [Bacteroidota bacterium]
MKPLENLINVEKARLLHELFPQEIPALLEYVNGMCLTIQEDEQLTRNQWENGLLTVEAWLSFVEEVRNKIERYGKRMHKQSRLFADQLFDGYVAIYMVHCMTLYTTIRKHPNHKFSLAIDLLFNP